MTRETIYMRCVGDAFLSLVPVDEWQEKALSKAWVEDEVVAVIIKRGRSLQQHRLFFGILQHVAEASEWETPQQLLVALKVQLGRYDLLALPSGKVVPVPHSVSFSEMSQDDFMAFFNEAIQLICDKVLGGYNPDDLINEVCSKTGVSPSCVRSSVLPPRSGRLAY